MYGEGESSASKTIFLNRDSVGQTLDEEENGSATLGCGERFRWRILNLKSQGTAIEVAIRGLIGFL